MKKFLSLALVLAMLASMLVVAPVAGAAESLATIEVTNAAGVAGETVSVNIVVTTATMSGYSLFFEYDKTRLELVQNGEVNATLPEDTAFAGDVDSADAADASKEWTETEMGTAPFENIFWNDTNATAHDCTAGVAVAVLTFKIKDDAAAGDAYVGLRYLCNENGYAPNEIYSGTTVGIIGDVEGEITFDAGKITVLPEGYADLTANDWSDFNFVLWDEDYGESAWYSSEAEYAIITGYTGSDATVVIPEGYIGEYENGDGEIEQVTTPIPVLVIQSVAFNNKAINSVVIPATVTEVQEAAFVNCASLTDVYVLGADTELATKAVGYSGNARRNATTGAVTWRSEATLLTDENGDALTTVYGVAGSAAADFAATETLGWDIACKLTFGGLTAYTGTNTVAPGQMINGDKTIAAWKNGDTVVAPGAALALTGDTALTAVEITTPTLVDGVSIKVTDSYTTSAMRFTANLAKADYDALAALGTVTVGTIITPVDYVNLAGGLTKEALDTLDTTNKYIDVVADGFYQDGIVAGSVRNFKKANVEVDYAAALYVTVELAGGSTFTVYSAYNYNTNRNFVDSIAKAAANDAITDDQAAWLNDQINKLS